MSSKDYQLNYTENAVAKEKLYDTDARLQKARMVNSILGDYLGDTKDLALLDMSCSNGLMTKQIAESFGTVIGIDIDEGALDHAKEYSSGSNIRYEKMDGLHTCFEDNKFDVVLCSQMYEHVPDPQQLMSEIHRILKPGGVCYFGATSRLKIIETHYGRIPFLSYLPKSLANRYLRLLGKGDQYYETLFTYWGLKRLVSSFTIVDYTLQVLRNPLKFHSEGITAPGLGAKSTYYAAKAMYPLLPGYIWILKKAT